VAIAVTPGALRLSLSCGLLLFGAQGWAADPTQPPALWLASAAASAAEGGTVGGPRLQTVLQPRQGGRPRAVIDGRLVSVGDRIGAARLVRLDEREAVLSGPGGESHLRLTPDVVKQPVAAPAHERKSTHHKEDQP